MRVLHLLDEASGQACPTTLALMGEALGRMAGVTHDVVLLGGAALRERALAAGLEKPVVWGVPFGRAVWAWPTLRARLGRGQGVDLVHAWSAQTVTLAALRWPRIPRLLTLTQLPTPRTCHWLRMLLAHGAGRSVILPISATIRRELLSRGVPETAVCLLRPGVDLGRVVAGHREVLRAGWGVDPRDRGAVVVAWLGDPPWATDALAHVLATGLAAEVFEPRQPQPRHRLVALMYPGSLRASEARSVMRDIGQPVRIVEEPRLATPWQVLPGCDLALFAGPGGGLAMLWAMAANVTIVAQADYATSEIVEAHHSAMLARPGDLRQLAHRITQLIDDPQLAWKLRDTARHECYSFFSRQRYLQQLKRVYEQMVAGRSIDLPPLEATGGLRFAGRG